MNALSSLLFLTALTISTPALVLKTGKRIAVDAPVRVNGEMVLFRSNASLFSIPASEVDFEATRGGASTITITPADDTAKLKVSSADRERLLRDLEQNHTGRAATKEQMSIPDPPKQSESTASKGDEWQWHNAARAHEEEVRRAKEQVDLLRQRQAELRARIIGYISQGYKTHQFSYDTTQLARTEEEIPQAELEVRRAERSQQQFLDDARRQGILPGWLR